MTDLNKFSGLLLSKLAVVALEFYESGYQYSPGVGARCNLSDGKTGLEIGLIRKDKRILGVLVRIDEDRVCPVRVLRAPKKDFELLLEVWLDFTHSERWTKLFPKTSTEYPRTYDRLFQAVREVIKSHETGSIIAGQTSFMEMMELRSSYLELVTKGDV